MPFTVAFVADGIGPYERPFCQSVQTLGTKWVLLICLMFQNKVPQWKIYRTEYTHKRSAIVYVHTCGNA